VPTLPRDPPLRVDLSVDDRGVLGRVRRVDRRAHPRPPPRSAPPVSRRVPPLRDAPGRIRLPDRETLPRVHGPRRLVRDRPRDRPTRPPESVEDALPVLPRDPRLSPRERP